MTKRRTRQKWSKVPIVAKGYMVAKRSRTGRSFFWMLKLVTAFAALTVMSMSALAQSDAETGRVQITFVKAGGEGNGNLFFEGQKYGLSINGIKISGFRITRIDLVGTALNLRSASDIIGTYAAADAKGATVGYTRMAQLENQKGVVLEVRGVNLNRRFTLNLSGMNIKNLGWQLPPE
jgi:hypothetical protein